MTRFRIEPARLPEDLGELRRLFADYAQSLDFKICFQSFDRELAELPGDYARPAGELLLARDPADQAVGVVALKPTAADRLELKRLYVSPAARGQGLGRDLVTAALDAARARGARLIELETLDEMAAARALYRAFGFRSAGRPQAEVERFERALLA